ncbi:hypothetical protein KJS94_18030 [Flavihumibacter rivuli]|uniref:Spy/CpxP family protein refolding chaperone n=1 Tax=Flavihumibacter rivuli TaxID=2838156 RepID=UPI001BDEBACC|nr:hypothetical protein [Flavihumibacter rivuli]ULQ56554.1 hypothetical protein KJS94_18030 [Flavihumibacter rivuli]
MKQMNPKTLLVIITVLLASNIILLGTYFIRNRSQHGRSGSDRSPVEYMTRELKLDQQQTEQFRSLWEANRNRNKALYDSLRTARERLYGYLKQEPQPDSLITITSASMAGMEQTLILNNYRHFRELRKICNPEQQVKLDTLITRMGKRGSRRK